jgi:release factor glutamine methyltransferase
MDRRARILRQNADLMAPETTRKLMDEGRRRLSGIPGADAALEARVLLRRILGFTEMEILAFPERGVGAGEARRYLRAVERRVRREPFAYIIGEREFWSIPLTVGSGVLIPRPETELLVEAVLEKAIRGDETIVEIGTGSGAVAVAVAKELPSARVIATDISRRALAVARSNARRHGAGNIEFRGGDLFRPLGRPSLGGRVDILVSNPPYVAEADWEDLEAEVRDGEPKCALVAGPTGLEFIHRLTAEAADYLKPDGFLIFEIGRGQARAVQALLKKNWTGVEIRKDLRSIPRAVVARRAIAPPRRGAGRTGRR